MTKTNILIVSLAIAIIWIISSSVLGLSSSIKHFDWGAIPNNLKDSLISIENYGRIPNSIQGYAGKRPKQYNTVRWIIRNASVNNLERLLYNHESGIIKGIAVNGLFSKNKKERFQYLKYCVSQEINVPYYASCQQLGGFLLEITTSNIYENLSLYFTKEEIDEIMYLIKDKDFMCK